MRPADGFANFGSNCVFCHVLDFEGACVVMTVYRISRSGEKLTCFPCKVRPALRWVGDAKVKRRESEAVTCSDIMLTCCYE